MKRQDMMRRYPVRGLLLTLAVLALGCGPQPSRPPPPGGGELPVPAAECPGCPEYAGRDGAELFAWSSVPVFELSLPAERWEWLRTHARDEQYEDAELRFEGEDYGWVGLRFKGGYGTLQTCVDDTGQLSCPKLSMKIKFDRLDPERRFFGLKRLNFHSMIRDASKLRERVAYDLYRQLDVVAPRSHWAVLRVNGESFGVFSLVEDVDGRFTEGRWPGNGDGNLYKEAWPQTDEVGYYAEHLETNQETAQHTAMIGFSGELALSSGDARGPTLARWADLDYLVRYMAVDDAIANWDGITTFYCGADACYNHNYFWYQEENRDFFWLIPWDLDNTFAPGTAAQQVPHWSTESGDCNARYGVFSTQVMAPGCDPLLAALASDRTRYVAAVQRLLDGPFAETRVRAEIAAHSELIREAVAADPLGPGVAAWQASVEQLERTLPVLRERLEALRDAAPLPALTLALDTVNGFEEVSDLGVALGALSLTNPSSTIAHGLNRSAPLSGLRDLRLDFEYRNDPPPGGAWAQWILFRLGLAGGTQSLASHTGIRLLLAADQARTVRIDLESDRHQAGDEGIKFGWEVPVDTTPTPVVLRFSEATLPSWARVTGDDLAVVLDAVSGIALHPFCVGRDGTGYLPGRTTDPGRLQIDDVEIFAE
jgi:spore coat protein CotH